jgi:putative GTP pyrophosphokinase
MKDSNPKPNAFAAEYEKRYNNALVSLAKNLELHIRDFMKDEPRIDRISVRAKSVNSFIKKVGTLNDGKPKYTEPLKQIQDQIGARIVVFYQSDVDRVLTSVQRYFTSIEQQRVVPDSESEFGYFGHHLILVLPSDVIEGKMDKSLVPDFFELQIKTLFQHSWSEANHDLAYKPGDTPLSPEQKRLIAFTSAQAWGADHLFNRLFEERTAK